MTKIIGLTGGIGSGKTTVANEFLKKGIPVYFADVEAKNILDSPDVLTRLKERFGAFIFNNNKIDRKKLAEIVFADHEKLAALNALIHPLVKAHFAEWLKNNQQFPYIIREAAILFESGSYKDCFKIINVNAPLEMRIQRVMDRDQTDRESVLKRINNQWTDEMRNAGSDYIINNLNPENTSKQIRKIIKELAIL